MRRRFRVEVQFDNGRVLGASNLRAARRMIKSRREPADIRSVWPNDLVVGTRIDRVEPARRPTRGA